MRVISGTTPDGDDFGSAQVVVDVLTSIVPEIFTTRVEAMARVDEMTPERRRNVSVLPRTVRGAKWILTVFIVVPRSDWRRSEP